MARTPDTSTFIEAGKIAQQAARVEKSWVPWELHEKQQLFAELEDREALFGGATGGGKTIALLADAARYVEIPNYSALLLRRNFPDLTQEAGLIDVAHNWWASTEARWNATDKEYIFPSGATIRFGHMDQEADKFRYQGGEYQYIGFDELTQFTETQYKYLHSRNRRKASLVGKVPLKMRGATNPGGVGGQWVYERFIPEDFSPEHAKQVKVWKKKLLTGREVAFVPSLLSDNPSVDYESYIESLDELDPITRAQYLKGDWMIQERGDILYMYKETHTVITWTEFSKVFGTRHIPEHWLLEMYQDFGTNKVHPLVTSWLATAAENSPVVDGIPMAGSVFLYRGLMMTENVTASLVADTMKELMRPHGELARIRRFEMSHEAASERMEYINAGLPASSWPQGKTRGIEQLKSALTLYDVDKPHPFRKSLMGHPKLYFVVEDDGIINPKTDEHLARWRSEAVAYKWAEPKSGEPPAKLVPHSLFNDAMDTLRAAAANYFPRVQERTADEILEQKIREKVADDFISPTAKDISYQMARLMSIREMRKDGYELDEFGNEVMETEEIGW